MPRVRLVRLHMYLRIDLVASAIIKDRDSEEGLRMCRLGPRFRVHLSRV